MGRGRPGYRRESPHRRRKAGLAGGDSLRLMEENGYGIGEYLSHSLRGGIGRFPAGVREVCQGSVGRGGGRSVGRSVGRWGRPAGRSVGRSVGSAGVGWGQGSWPGQGGGRVSPHLGRRAGLASLTACEGLGRFPCATFGEGRIFAKPVSSMSCYGHILTKVAPLIRTGNSNVSELHQYWVE